ncbi:MAG TPA: CoA-transferase, partial [Roseiflexaceae bacterium]
FGNLNTTVIGDYATPKVRLPGSGGACEIAINARRLFYIMRLKRRAFVDRLDFVTSPGHLGGGDERVAAGIPGSGPQLVITDLALFDFDSPAREMRLVALHPGVTLDQARAEVGWEVRLAETIETTPAPTAEELRLVRKELDPQGMYR